MKGRLTEQHGAAQAPQVFVKRYVHAVEERCNLVVFLFVEGPAGPDARPIHVHGDGALLRPRADSQQLIPGGQLPAQWAVGQLQQDGAGFAAQVLEVFDRQDAVTHELRRAELQALEGVQEGVGGVLGELQVSGGVHGQVKVAAPFAPHAQAACCAMMPEGMKTAASLPNKAATSVFKGFQVIARAVVIWHFAAVQAVCQLEQDRFRGALGAVPGQDIGAFFENFFVAVHR
jgi:hypothetical protein